MKLLLDPRTDASLIRHALAGRARSLEALVLRYQRKAYAVARAISLDPDAADDIVQEAFLLALQNLRSLRVHASFGPWFMQIVRNVARKRLRKEPVEFSPDVEPSSVTELDTAEVAETRDRIWSEVRRLPVVLREAVFLYYHEGRSVREVARALEISSAAAKKRLQAGREQLSERLWRALESTLRDLLPSARGWKAQGRRIALVTIASLPVGRTLEASVGSSGGLGLAGGSSVSVALSSLGVFVMANKAIFGSVLIIAVLSGGVFLWPNKDSDPAAIDDVATGTDGTADSRSASEAHRANASIGRALRLAMINVGGARPGVSDMALLGHPGKFSYCLAEDEEGSPFSPLHTTFGFAPEDSVVTVIGAEAPHSVVYSGNADDPENHLKLLEVLTVGISNLATNNAVLRNGSVVVVLNPEHANILSDAGLNRKDVATRLFELAHHPRADLERLAGAFVGRAGDHERINCFESPEQILILMAGGSGLYSMVMPSWCAGAHRNSAVSVQVEMDPSCEVPGLNRQEG